MTIPPADLNREIDNFIAEIQNPQAKDTPLAPTLVTANASQLNAVRDICRLSAEQVAASGATVRRLTLEDNIDGYMFTLDRFYPGVTKEDSPAYLKKSGTDEAYITSFFENIDSIPAQVIDFAQQTDSTTVDVAKQWKTDWDKAKGEETLDKEAKALVRAALDFRIKLIGDLRYLGYTGAEIEVVRNKQ